MSSFSFIENYYTLEEASKVLNIDYNAVLNSLDKIEWRERLYRLGFKELAYKIIKVDKFTAGNLKDDYKILRKYVNDFKNMGALLKKPKKTYEKKTRSVSIDKTLYSWLEEKAAEMTRAGEKKITTRDICEVAIVEFIQKYER